MPAPIPLHLALAEDNPDDVLLVRMALRDAGLNCTLHVFHDGEQAISFFETLDRHSTQPSIDLLLLDLHLPKRDGEEILKRLRSTERSAQTPVVVMTSSSAPHDYEKAQKNAAVYYFEKPSSAAEYMRLGGIVREVLLPAKTGLNHQGVS